MKSYKCCISSVEIVSPSVDEMITHEAERFKEFYSTLVSSMGQIALQHGCEILRPLPVGLQFSFPQTSNLTDVSVITSVLECFLTQLEIRQSLSIDMDGQVREISCRIIADYGTLSISEPGDDIELVPRLSSIDRICWRTPVQADTVVLGNELYKVVSAFPKVCQEYNVESLGDYIIDSSENVAYSRYRLARKQPH